MLEELAQLDGNICTKMLRRRHQIDGRLPRLCEIVGIPMQRLPLSRVVKELFIDFFHSYVAACDLLGVAHVRGRDTGSSE